jgi:uncharacterized protein YuzE
MKVRYDARADAVYITLKEPSSLSAILINYST